MPQSSNRPSHTTKEHKSATKQSHLSLLGLVTPILGEEVGEDVAAAASNVDEGPLLAQTEARRHRQHHAHRLDQQRPLAQVTTDDEATQDGLDLQMSKNITRHAYYLDHQLSPADIAMVDETAENGLDLEMSKNITRQAH